MARNGEWFLIRSAEVLTSREALPETDVLVEGGCIRAVGRGLPPEKTVISGSGLRLIPGLIDIHVQGAGGCDVTDGTRDSFRTISTRLASFGTTSFLATTVFLADRKEQPHLSGLASFIEKDPCGARILGIHLEGPYVSRDKPGMIQPSCICPVPERSVEEILSVCGGHLRMMTLAPELPGALDTVPRLLDRGVVPAIGHTNATWAETVRAFDAGVLHVCHLFNAMRSFHHREPGALGAILMDSRPVCQLIPDGNHVHPEVVRWVFALKGRERISLITDGVGALGPEGGTHRYMGIEYTVRDGAGYCGDSTLIGTVLPQLRLLVRCSGFAGIPVQDLLVSATLVPARVLGLAERKGSIAVGKDADLVLVDREWNVKKTWVEGELAFDGDRQRDGS